MAGVDVIKGGDPMVVCTAAGCSLSDCTHTDIPQCLDGCHFSPHLLLLTPSPHPCPHNTPLPSPHISAPHRSLLAPHPPSGALPPLGIRCSRIDLLVLDGSGLLLHDDTVLAIDGKPLKIGCYCGSVKWKHCRTHTYSIAKQLMHLHECMRLGSCRHFAILAIINLFVYCMYVLSLYYT